MDAQKHFQPVKAGARLLGGRSISVVTGNTNMPTISKCSNLQVASKIGNMSLKLFGLMRFDEAYEAIYLISKSLMKMDLTTLLRSRGTWTQRAAPRYDALKNIIPKRLWCSWERNGTPSMEKRVKIFFEPGVDELEDSVNKFLSSMAGKLQDIKYQYISPSKDVEEWYATALLIYTPGGQANGEEEKRQSKNQEGHGGVQGKITPLWEQGRATCKV